MTLLLSKSEVASLLEPSSVVLAIEAAFASPDRSTERFHVARGTSSLHLVVGGAGARSPLGVKANLRALDVSTGRQRVRGVLMIFDDIGDLLAIMDSTEITLIRTAALAAIAVDRLGFSAAEDVLFVGSGALMRYQLLFLRRVARLRRVRVWTRHRSRVASLVANINESGLRAELVTDVSKAAKQSDVIITMTPSPVPVLRVEDLTARVLVVALGADGPGKNELDPRILSSSRVVVDDLVQCARHGELSHAIDAGLMTADDVFATLSEVVAGTVPPPDDSQRVVLDSTGTALQDQAAALLAIREARRRGIGRTIDFHA